MFEGNVCIHSDKRTDESVLLHVRYLAVDMLAFPDEYRVPAFKRGSWIRRI